MKNISILLITGFLLILGACDEGEFLDRYPLDAPNPQNFFIDAETARMAVNACYYPWQWGGSSTFKRDMTILLDASRR